MRFDIKLRRQNKFMTAMSKENVYLKRETLFTVLFDRRDITTLNELIMKNFC